MDGILPKILLTNGLVPYNVIRFVALTDYKIIEKAFKERKFSSRAHGSSAKSRLFFFTTARDSGLFEYANDIGLKTGNTKNAIESDFVFIGISLNTNSKIFYFHHLNAELILYFKQRLVIMTKITNF